MVDRESFTAPDGSNIYIIIGKRVGMKRRGQGISLDSLAVKLGIPAERLAKIEAGAIKVSIVDLDRIAGELGSTRFYMLVGLDSGSIRRNMAELSRCVDLCETFFTLKRKDG